MKIVKDIEGLPELFKVETNLLSNVIEWGMVITDNQIIVFKQVEGQVWEGHSDNARTVLEQAFPYASSVQLYEIFLKRVVFIVCDPSEELIIYVTDDFNLSLNQFYATLKYLEDMKVEDVIRNIEISFYDGDKEGEECSLDVLISKIKLKQPQFSDIDKRELIIGIPIEEYLLSSRKISSRK